MYYIASSHICTETQRFILRFHKRVMNESDVTPVSTEHPTSTLTTDRKSIVRIHGNRNMWSGRLFSVYQLLFPVEVHQCTFVVCTILEMHIAICRQRLHRVIQVYSL